MALLAWPSSGEIWNTGYMRAVAISPPLWARIYAVLFCGGVSVAIMTVNTLDYTHGRAGGGVFLSVIPMVAVLIALAYRLFTLSCQSGPDGLMIHNLFWTWRV